MKEYHYTARVYDPLLSVFMRPIRQKIIALVKQGKYGSVLDVCCGTGEQLKMLKEHGFEGKGIDLSEAMLAVAQKGEFRVDCQLEDATQISYGDTSFELVTTTFALHEKKHEDARAIVDEMVRLTIEGGDIIIVDYELSDNTSWLSKKLIFLIERIAGGEHYKNFRAYLNSGGLSALLTDTPLHEVRRYYFGEQGIVLLLLRKEQIEH